MVMSVLLIKKIVYCDFQWDNWGSGGSHPSPMQPGIFSEGDLSKSFIPGAQ